MDSTTPGAKDGRPAVVLIVPMPPGPSGNGLRMRAGLLLEAALKLGPTHVVVVPVVGLPHGDPRPDGRVASWEVLPVAPAPDQRADLVERLGDPALRAQAEALYPRPGLCRTATLQGAEKIALLVRDAVVVIVMRMYLAPYLDLVLGQRHRPLCVIDVDDVESSVLRALGEVDEAARFEALERHYLPLFDLVLACSQEDASDLAERYLVTPEVVPNAVRLPAFGEQHAPAIVENDLVFVANFHHAPNVEAARWLCQQVVPLLPPATVGLIGASPPPSVGDLAQRPGVTVSGTVTDVSPFYAASRVAVVPLGRGGGTSIKLLEALAHRRPVVTTPIGARGAPVESGRHLLVAAEPAAFAAACRRLLDDASLGRRLAGAGYDLVARDFTVDGMAARLEAMIVRHLSFR